MTAEQARLPDTRAPRDDIDGDVIDLADLSSHWEPCYTFAVDYRRPVTWTARPADGGKPITAGSAADLRTLLRLAGPVDRGAI